MEISIWDPEHRKLDFKMTTQWMVTNILWRFIEEMEKREAKFQEEKKKRKRKEREENKRNRAKERAKNMKN